MSFNKLPKKPETATATASTPAVTTPESAAQLPALFGGAKANALLAVVDQVDQAGAQQMIYPIIQISGGKSGGMFAPISAVPQEVADQLPQGKKPIDCVFLTYRVEAAAWAEKYGDGEQSAPCWSAAAGNDNPDLAKMIEKAARAYHYTKADDKGLFDWNNGEGTGHVRASLAFLVYLPAIDDVVVIQTPAHYPSWTEGMNNAKKLMDDHGVLVQFPCKLSIVSTSKQVNSYTVYTHALDFDKKIDAEGKAWYDKCNKYLERVKADDVLRAQINDWAAGADKPANDNIVAKLAKAASIKA